MGCLTKAIPEQVGSCAATGEAAGAAEAARQDTSASLQVIETQMQLSHQFYHPLLQWKGPTTLHNHGLHHYMLGLMKGLGVFGGFCCYWVFLSKNVIARGQTCKNEPRSFK